MSAKEVFTQNQIREIVRQVKSGEKNKNAAFEELRGMLRHSSSRTDEQISSSYNLPPPPPFEDSVENTLISSVGSDIDQQVSSSNEYCLSHEDRRLIIDKLLEKKRQDRLRRVESPKNNMDASSAEDFEKSPIRNRTRHNKIKIFTRDRPKSAGSFRRPNRSSSPTFKRHLDDSAIRMRRIHQTDIAVRNDMYRECTFRPHVAPLPEGYSSKKDDNVPFYDRVMRWQRERDLEHDRRQSAVVQTEDGECSFHPTINRNSMKAVKEIRKNENADIVERLYKSSETANMLKAKFIEDELRKERAAEDQECTFHPRVSSRRKSFQTVRSRFDQKLNRPTEAEASSLPECTFVPQIKGVAPHMVSAKMYISTDVVERLTRPLPPPSTDSDQSLQAFDSSFRSYGGVGAGLGLGAGAGQRSAVGTSSSLTESKSTVRTISKEERERRESSFNEFIARQTQTTMRKEAVVKESEKKDITTFKLNEHSEKLLSGHGDFFERLASSSAKRQMEVTAISQSLDKDYTFQPSLSSRSKSLRSRSFYELSRGDLLRKETNQRMRRLKNEQEELLQLTFKPTISKLAQSLGRSHLQLQDDPDGYIERYLADCKDKENQRLKRLHDVAARESDDCTFAPQTKDCPAYIRRIAKSLAIVKASRPQEEAPSKPEWK